MDISCDGTGENEKNPVRGTYGEASFKCVGRLGFECLIVCCAQTDSDSDSRSRAGKGMINLGGKYDDDTESDNEQRI